MSAKAWAETLPARSRTQAPTYVEIVALSIMKVNQIFQPFFAILVKTLDTCWGLIYYIILLYLINLKVVDYIKKNLKILI